MKNYDDIIDNKLKNYDDVVTDKLKNFRCVRCESKDNVVSFPFRKSDSKKLKGTDTIAVRTETVQVPVCKSCFQGFSNWVEKKPSLPMCFYCIILLAAYFSYLILGSFIFKPMLFAYSWVIIAVLAILIYIKRARHKASEYNPNKYLKNIGNYNILVKPINHDNWISLQEWLKTTLIKTEENTGLDLNL